jgi:hypothetical protein
VTISILIVTIQLLWLVPMLRMGMQTGCSASILMQSIEKSIPCRAWNEKMSMEREDNEKT